MNRLQSLSMDTISLNLLEHAHRNTEGIRGAACLQTDHRLHQCGSLRGDAGCGENNNKSATFLLNNFSSTQRLQTTDSSLLMIVSLSVEFSLVNAYTTEVTPTTGLSSTQTLTSVVITRNNSRKFTGTTVHSLYGILLYNVHT